MGYRAEQQKDGTWTIFDVPVFAEAVDTRGPKPLKFDAGWLSRALMIAQQREREGYLPPLHVRHHDGQADVAAAGHFRLTRVAPMAYEGQQRMALYADLVGVPDEVYQQVRAGRLPYRSVEIHKGLREIDSLALLDHEVPFFRFELLRIADEGAVKPAAAATPAAIQTAKAARLPALVFAQGVTIMADEKKPEDAKKFEQADGEPGAAAPAAAPAAPAITVDAIAQAVMKCLAPLYQKLGIGMAEAAPPPALPGAGPADTPVAAPMRAADASPAPAAPAAQAPVDPALARVEGELIALRAKLAQSERAQRIGQRATALKLSGHPEPVIARFSAMAEQNEAAALAFADGLESFAPAPPPPPWTGDVAPRQDPTDPAEVKAYAADPEKLATARRLAASWKTLKARGATKHDLATFLAANLADDLTTFVQGR